MNSPDPSSLQNLNDIILPDAATWWPLAIGWYFVIGLLLIVLLWFLYRSINNLFKNQYRRAALKQLKVLAEYIHHGDTRDSSLRQIPVLLKRTALSCYPRERVASLSGKHWHEFLNSMVSTPSFTGSTASILDTVSYSAGDLGSLDEEAADQLLKSCEYWLRNHKPC